MYTRYSNRPPSRDRVYVVKAKLREDFDTDTQNKWEKLPVLMEH